SCMFFFSHWSCAHRVLHSFPTRRSSDLMTRKVSAEVDLVHQQTQNQRYGSSHIGATAKDISNVVTDAASGVVDIRNILCSSANMRRSEERFSRNAETDLVCRLLLEKKKVIAYILQ